MTEHIPQEALAEVRELAERSLTAGKWLGRLEACMSLWKALKKDAPPEISDVMTEATYALASAMRLIRSKRTQLIDGLAKW